MEQIVPVEKNKYYEMQIESLGHDGEGVGRIAQFAVFVPNALPGDKINVKIVKVKKSYAYGKLIDIISPSPYRVEPLCPIHGKCGGCQLQHLAYSEQLKFKKQKVIDNLERIGGLKGLEVYDTLGMENPFRYRNKVQLPVGLSKEGRIQIGFYAPRSHNIIEMETCAIQPEVNDELIKHIKKWMVGYNISPYDENTGTGLIRHIFTRIGFKTGEIMLVLITNGRKIPYVDQLVDGTKQVNPNVTSIIQNINSQKTNVIMGKENKLLHGADYITDYIGEVKFKISPMSFYQVNPMQTEVLYNKALEYADLKGDEIVFDLYCGIGTISLFMAKRAKKVVGVEIVPQAIEDARKNAEINQITNVEFHVGATEEVVPALYDAGYKADVVIVDPPRKGCDESLLETIVQMRIDKVVYVSCNPSTLARDLRFMVDRGYKVQKVQPVDMFPQTNHVETVVLMSRGK